MKFRKVPSVPVLKSSNVRLEQLGTNIDLVSVHQCAISIWLVEDVCSVFLAILKDEQDNWAIPGLHDFSYSYDVP